MKNALYYLNNLSTKEGKSKEYVFDFEKLNVYEMSLDFVRDIFRVSKKLPSDYQYSLGDQIRRAALSIINNIAEGSGKISKKEKSQFYRISLTSARECIPIVTILDKEKLILETELNSLRKDCIHICNMLGRLIAVI